MALKKETPAILITKMYTGRYLKDNIGHEIINLFQADNDGFYLYFNDEGKVRDGISATALLLVRGIKANVVEVIALARGFEADKDLEDMKNQNKEHKNNEELLDSQRRFIKKQKGGDIKYGNVSIIDIFKGSKQQNIYVTFKATEILTPKSDKRILLYHNKVQGNREKETKYVLNEIPKLPKIEDICFEIKDKNLDNEKLRLYIESSKNKDTYTEIVEKLVNNEDLWESGKVNKVDVAGLLTEPDTLFDICRISDDENCITNALRYFMNRPEYRELWRGFFQYLGRKVNKEIYLGNNFQAFREVSLPKESKLSGRMDILITDDNNVIVIENKVKSNINSISSEPDGRSQLDQYYEYINETEEFSSKNKVFFILHPDYNIPKIKGKMEGSYHKFTYSFLYDYLSRNDFGMLIEKDANFRALMDVLKRHSNISANAYLKDEMYKKFRTRILELKTL